MDNSSPNHYWYCLYLLNTRSIVSKVLVEYVGFTVLQYFDFDTPRIDITNCLDSGASVIEEVGFLHVILHGVLVSERAIYMKLKYQTNTSNSYLMDRISNNY